MTSIARLGMVALLMHGTADVTKIDLVGRLGGDSYSTIRDRFDMPKPNPKR